jgi:hypothetical protein
MMARRARRARSATDALIIFAKAPEPGQVKTRLSPPLTSDQAARLHEAFVLDGVRATDRLPASITRWLACAPSSQHPFFERLARRGRLRRLTQTGDTLGDRMASALRQALEAGATRAVLIGTDVPTLPPAVITDAFAQLRRADVVLGPACDGGYYLVGVARRVPPIFDRITWSRPTVLEATLARINALGLRGRLLPFWYDVDGVPSLRLLAAHLGLLRRAGQLKSRAAPRATARLCAELIGRQKQKAPGVARGPRIHGKTVR